MAEWSASTEPITREMFERAVAKMEAQRWTPDPGQLAAAEFMRTTPEHLRSHPTVLLVCAVLLSGQPVHPNEEARLKAAYEELVAAGGANPTSA